MEAPFSVLIKFKSSLPSHPMLEYSSSEHGTSPGVHNIPQPTQQGSALDAFLLGDFVSISIDNSVFFDIVPKSY
jgi:hypothetical protein